MGKAERCAVGSLLFRKGASTAIMHGLAQYNVGKVKDTEPDPQARTNPGTQATDITVAPCSEDDSELNKQRVRMEAERVQAKFVSSVDTSSEVILRLDFMNMLEHSMSLLLPLLDVHTSIGRVSQCAKDSTCCMWLLTARLSCS